MNYIKSFIDERNEQYKKHSFIRFLQDTRIPALDRLSYIPYGLYFVMTFADINALLLPEENTDTPLQTMINIHGQEDSKHWAWFLQDIHTLGYNISFSFVEAAKFIWSKDAIRTRLFCYKLAQLCLNADALQKLVIIESIEKMGNVWLDNTVAIAKEAGLQDKLVYLGQYHLDREVGHAIGTSEKDIKKISLPEASRANAIKIVTEIYAGMEGFNQDLLERATKGYKKFHTKTIKQEEYDVIS